MANGVKWNPGVILAAVKGKGMSDIDFSKKFSVQRPLSKPITAESEYDIVRLFESDRGRIINSAAIRRLQQKTQVFPLERNAAVRSRLTHSMEVQQIGRYIAKDILVRIKGENRLDALGLSLWQTPFESMVEMACLMHDIGNPPLAILVNPLSITGLENGWMPLIFRMTHCRVMMLVRLKPCG